LIFFTGFYHTHKQKHQSESYIKEQTTYPRYSSTALPCPALPTQHYAVVVVVSAPGVVGKMDNINNDLQLRGQTRGKWYHLKVKFWIRQSLVGSGLNFVSGGI
jgi:hypothetical protein